MEMNRYDDRDDKPGLQLNHRLLITVVRITVTGTLVVRRRFQLIKIAAVGVLVHFL